MLTFIGTYIFDYSYLNTRTENISTHYQVGLIINLEIHKLISLSNNVNKIFVTDLFKDASLHFQNNLLLNFSGYIFNKMYHLSK
jgi:hypothetical protein